MLGGYIAEVPEWKEKGHEYVDAITDKITSDLTSVYRIKAEINEDQIIKIKQHGIRLVKLMQNNQYDSSKIEAILQLFD